MDTMTLNSWGEFREELQRYCQLNRLRQNEFWFRGQSSSKWQLVSTLDRWRKFENDEKRTQTYQEMLQEFKNEVYLLGSEDDSIQNGDTKFELLARHHGLPSPLLDWTLSPFVAAYFAYVDASQDLTGDHVSIWRFDISKIDTSSENLILLSDKDMISGNERALRQRSVFMRVDKLDTIDHFVSKAALMRYDLPKCDRVPALKELNEMLVNATTLMYDLTGAAKTAAVRCELE